MLVDHPDVTAEAALAALGGSTPVCLRIAAAWHERRHDPVLLTLGRRPGEADIGLGRAPGAGARLVESEQATRRDRLLLLFTLPAPFIDRLVLTAAADAAARWHEPAYRTAHGLRLGAALAARATPAMRRLAATLAGPEEAVTVQAAPATDGATAHLRATRVADHGLTATATLPLAWIARVWGAGISEPGPGDHLVLDRGAVSDDGRSVEVHVAEWRPDGAAAWEGISRRAVLRRPDVDAPWTVELA